MTLVEWKTFLGYACVANIVLFTISIIVIMLLKNMVARQHGTFFGIDEATVKSHIYLVMGIHKSLIIVFFLVPWLVLEWAF